MKVANERAANAYDKIFNGFEAAKNSINLNPVIDEAINMILIKVDSIYKLIAVLSLHNDLDEYCTGALFGMYGSNNMLKIANRMINPSFLYENSRTRFSNLQQQQKKFQ